MKFFKHNIIVLFLLSVTGLIQSCGKTIVSRIPDDVYTMSHEKQLDWLLSHLSSDSVAKFLCDIMIEKDEVLRIEDFRHSLIYCCQNLNEEDRKLFGEEINRYVDSFTPENKMKIFRNSMPQDPQKLGFYYAKDAYENKTDTNIIHTELEVLHELCKDDSIFYISFKHGMEIFQQIQ